MLVLSHALVSSIRRDRKSIPGRAVFPCVCDRVCVRGLLQNGSEWKSSVHPSKAALDLEAWPRHPWSPLQVEAVLGSLSHTK